jgi:hypothetical protein
MREVAGVFRARDAMDEAVTALLSSGFDRADIDVMVGAGSTGKTSSRKDCGGGVAGSADGSAAARTHGGMALQTVANDKRSSRIRTRAYQL